MKSIILWILVALLGAFAFATLALSQGETVNALWLIVAAVSTYAIAYRFYSKFIAERVMELNDRRLTPAERHNDGLDYVPTHKWVLFGHHFAAIAGAGPLVGPVLAAQMGYLPGTLWILVGVTLAGDTRLVYEGVTDTEAMAAFETEFALKGLNKYFKTK